MTNPNMPTPIGDTSDTADPTAFSLDPRYEDRLLTLLYLLDMQHEVKDYYIEELDHYREADLQQKLVELKVDELCRALGIKPTKWTDDFVSYEFMPSDISSESSIDETTLNEHKIHATNIGAFLFNESLRVLPIEWGDEGGGAVHLTLRSSQGYDVTLRTDGEYWTDYTEEDDQGRVDSEMTIKVRYNVDVTRTAQPATTEAN